MSALRQSIPMSHLLDYYHCGWAYVMPDFDKPDHSIIEWLSDKIPVYPHRVPDPQTENANERAASRA